MPTQDHFTRNKRYSPFRRFSSSSSQLFIKILSMTLDHSLSAPGTSGPRRPSTSAAPARLIPLMSPPSRVIPDSDEEMEDDVSEDYGHVGAESKGGAPVRPLPQLEATAAQVIKDSDMGGTSTTVIPGLEGGSTTTSPQEAEARGGQAVPVADDDLSDEPTRRIRPSRNREGLPEGDSRTNSQGQGNSAPVTKESTRRPAGSMQLAPSPSPVAREKAPAATGARLAPTTGADGIMPDSTQDEPLDLLFGGPYGQKAPPSKETLLSHSKLYLQAVNCGIAGDPFYYEIAAAHLTLLRYGFEPKSEAFETVKSELCEALSKAPTPMELFKRLDKDAKYGSCFIWVTNEKIGASWTARFKNLFDFTPVGVPDYYSGISAFPTDIGDPSVTCRHSIDFQNMRFEIIGRIPVHDMLAVYLNGRRVEIESATARRSEETLSGEALTHREGTAEVASDHMEVDEAAVPAVHRESTAEVATDSMEVDEAAPPTRAATGGSLKPAQNNPLKRSRLDPPAKSAFVHDWVKPSLQRIIDKQGDKGKQLLYAKWVLQQPPESGEGNKGAK
ncbi:hypothetical protein KVR01_002131 [Diaporthe batatas]|uniref:uncharacterized protein n=1 Tax=Diaporthe batatas TaxID=748121 RepID=UPI001D037982|nr:uncharacterized protein KVR01_002131 [Diaporthe batatas]KAG8166442.1 hypothetical protein KVR01_002131 [Diaporthe batatas]